MTTNKFVPNPKNDPETLLAIAAMFAMSPYNYAMAHGHLSHPGPAHTHTIGLAPKIGYEVLLIGMPLDYAEQFLHHVVDVVYNEQGIVLNVPDYKYAVDYPVVFKETQPHRVRPYVKELDLFYDQEVPVVQMMFCDKHGKFPWDAGYDTAYMGPRQPNLFES